MLRPTINEVCDSLRRKIAAAPSTDEIILDTKYSIYS
jgi:hypothetical protein